MFKFQEDRGIIKLVAEVCFYSLEKLLQRQPFKIMYFSVEITYKANFT